MFKTKTRFMLRYLVKSIYRKSSYAMAFKLSANLNFLFTEDDANLADRISKAGNSGFRGIEIGYPSEDVMDEVKTALKETELEVVLINICTDGGYEFSAGPTSIPGGEEQFLQNLNKTVDFAKEVGCKKIHLMAGKQIDKVYADHFKTYLHNLKVAADILQAKDIMGLIEPINKYAVPGYFLNSYNTAVDVLEEVGSPNIKLMIDVFHMQHICGNLCNAFSEMKPYIGHIQIAQVPHRHEPDVPGELDFSFVFDVIKNSGYSDWVGCEYVPRRNTVDGLGWLTKYNLEL